MHDPLLSQSPYYDREARSLNEGKPASTAVQITVQSLLKDVAPSVEEATLITLLDYLRLRNRPFISSPESYTPRDIVSAGYALVNAFYWNQIKQLKGRILGSVLKELASVFQYGIGPLYGIEARQGFFVVYPRPTCPVAQAYRHDWQLCKGACEERSRLGVFTNPIISQALSFYHPALKLRLAQHRPTVRGACVYRLVLEV